jgi:hypothetical protein
MNASVIHTDEDVRELDISVKLACHENKEQNK